ncbi:methylase of polypeptide subunit release factors [Actinopolyspora biskrensis]|uniref:Methylase of polypeptide subunit release factors n=1 Tax=Actinopolyspora biskrensis TaxID=1470178 RepID=A0A852YUU5_9ACTN|nr:class I SAM-dependent methyltransferase [Actinopolyspora biskrensis]NYH77339.1 methylase of polypeptide subunit release factors [Actinopolyspora biskrensis]
MSIDDSMNAGAGAGAGATSMETNTHDLFGLEGCPQRINRSLSLNLTDHTYLPKAKDPRRDWVASVALPALRSYAAVHGESSVDTFATIGTGAGTDVLAAIETLNPSTALVTDLHEEVVEHAVDNIRRNVPDSSMHTVEGYVGHLGEPLTAHSGTIDLLYENLPNIPAPTHVDLAAGQATSSFFDTSALAGVPAGAHRYLLALHCAMLNQARTLLSPSGRVVCSIGARAPLTEILDVLNSTGFDTELLGYTWKIQSEPEEVIGGYVDQERKGGGPFHFYPVDALARVLSPYSPQQAAGQAKKIEQDLAGSAFDVDTAFEAVKRGDPVGHTVVAVQAAPVD